MRTKMIYILLWWPSWYLLFFMHGTEGELQWVVTEKISSYGQNLTLFCSVDNCCNEDAGWTEEGTTIFLDFKTYSNDTKYGSTYNESGFGLVIRNLSETDLNKTYECTYGFQKSTHQYLLQEDVFRKDGPSTDKENSTTDEGDNTIIIVLGIIVPLVLIALGILICYLYRRQQRKKQADPINPVHYNAVQQQESIPTLTKETNDDLIGRQEQGANHPDPRPDNESTWCQHRHCREMTTEAEKVCCKQTQQNYYSRQQESIPTLTKETNDDLIGRQEQGGNHPDPRPDNESIWCHHRHCREMTTEAEKVCCKQTQQNCYSRQQKYDRLTRNSSERREDVHKKYNCNKRKA